MQLKSQNTLQGLYKFLYVILFQIIKTSFPICPCQPLLSNTDTSIICRTIIALIFKYMLKVHIQPYANGRYHEALNINILLLLLFSLANTGQFHFSLSIEIRRESSNIKINIQRLNILVGNLPI